MNIKTDNNNTIKSNYAEYNKGTGQINLKGNITAVDNKIILLKQTLRNIMKIRNFKSIGNTKIITSENT